MHFVKMHGAENDYIFVNCFLDSVDDPSSLAREMSSRHTGVGADGLIMLLPSRHGDARMRIFNADGSEAEMCGNGARCAARLLYEEDLVRSPEMTLETLSGTHRVRLLFDESGEASPPGVPPSIAGVEVEMGIPLIGGHRESSPAGGKGRDGGSGGNGSSEGGGGGIEEPLFAEGREDPIRLGGRLLRGLRVDVGNPHFVIFLEDVFGFPLARIGPRIEKLPRFPRGTNVEFVQVCNDDSLLVRVWERGVGETRSCGTGAVAAALAAVARGLAAIGEISVRLKGGRLTVRWDGKGPAWLVGNAVEVFRGNWRRKRDKREDSGILPYGLESGRAERERGPCSF